MLRRDSQRVLARREVGRDEDDQLRGVVHRNHVRGEGSLACILVAEGDAHLRVVARNLEQPARDDKVAPEGRRAVRRLRRGILHAGDVHARCLVAQDVHRRFGNRLAQFLVLRKGDVDGVLLRQSPRAIPCPA